MGVSTSRIAPAVEELPHEADDPGPGLEDPAHLGVDHQVQVALAVARLDIGEAVEFLRQGLQRFGQEGKLPHCQGELIGPGAEQGALDPDDVAQINEFFKAAKGLLAQHLLLEIDLQTAGAVLDMGEAGLAELPEEHETAGQTEVWSGPGPPTARC